VACHSADARARAPVLEEIYSKRVPLHDGSSVLADEDYLRESIRNPNAKIVAGYQAPSIMPPYGDDTLKEEQLIELIAYLRTLGPGETPPRIETADPPLARDAAQNGRQTPGAKQNNGQQNEAPKKDQGQTK
jgi:cytochrome c oxidase subunit 2